LPVGAPSVPFLLLPQQSACPPVVNPQEKWRPAPTLLKTWFPATRTGTELWVLLPSPSAPNPPNPQQ
jgi:hypothetical protein